jgi:4-diphosphocytidyl-2C-methyl-D-erythritol kinase
MKEKAYAKINIALGIEGVQDGMHLLNMLTCEIDLYDEVEVVFRADSAINCKMDNEVASADNSAVRAAMLMMDAFGFGGADINIKKNIPFCSGLGGSTADGVAVIKAYEKEYGIKATTELLQNSEATLVVCIRAALIWFTEWGYKLWAVKNRLITN